MRITSKGQVTIPQEIREKAGLLSGTDVYFTIENEKVCIIKNEMQTRGRKIVEHLRGRGKTRMTTDQIMALTRGDQ